MPFAAAQQLGWKRIPAVVRDEPDDGQAYLLPVVANLQREDLSPKEESAALEVLVREWGWTTRQVVRGHQPLAHVCQSPPARLRRSGTVGASAPR